MVDPEARHGHRSRKDRYDGYKLHVSVDVTSDLFVAGQATTATAADARVLPRLPEADRSGPPGGWSASSGPSAPPEGPSGIVGARRRKRHALD